MLEIFLKLRSFRDNLFQGKQRKQGSTKECFEGIYFNSKNYCSLEERIKSMKFRKKLV